MGSLALGSSITALQLFIRNCSYTPVHIIAASILDTAYFNNSHKVISELRKVLVAILRILIYNITYHFLIPVALNELYIVFLP